jgi:hypothetical protein
MAETVLTDRMVHLDKMEPLVKMVRTAQMVKMDTLL